MKSLNVNELGELRAGEWFNFVDGFCAALYGAQLLKLIPVAGTVIIGLDVACFGWAIARGAGWVEE
jgi:hypothetical protein